MSKKQNSLDYEFAPTGGGDETGTNDPVMSTFKGDYAYFLARESLQNITDAAETYPVKASFDVFSINSKDLPKSNSLREIFASCWRYASEDSRGKDFFKKSWESLSGNGKQIHVLKISDYNTKGMRYVKGDKECDYHKFMKSVGSSSKSKAGGGSWGLGKGSYFNASSFKMIFLSSVYDQDKYIFQGKLRLSSHEMDNQIMQGNGSFGLRGQEPVTDPNLIPEMFFRDKQGTDIYIVAFSKPAKWKKEIIKSVLNNFWPAIYKNILEVNIAGEKITSKNIESKLYKYYSLDKIDTDRNPNPLPYYLAYTDTQNNKRFKEKLPTLGVTHLHVLENEKFNSRVVYMRKTGMIIQKKTKPSPRRYVAVFECGNKKGNEILQRMENPTHDKWDKNNDQGFSTKPPKELERAQTEIDTFVSNGLKQMAKIDEKKALTIKGLEKWLGMPADEDYLSGTPYDISNLGEIEISKEEKGIEISKEHKSTNDVQIPIKPIMQTTDIKGVKEGQGKLFGFNEGVGGKGSRKSKSRISSGSDETKRVGVPIKFRSFTSGKKGKIKHNIIVRNDSANKIDIYFHALGDRGFIPINIKEAWDMNSSKLVTQKNCLKNINFITKSKFEAKIIFDTSEKLSLNLSAYENR